LRVLAVVERALDIPESERDAFVAHECADSWLLMEVRRFLDACLAPDSRLGFLERQGVERYTGILKDDAAHPERDLSGRSLPGGIRLERPFGRGGMAEVYLADDAPHNRKVAVKVVDLEHATNLGIDRFLREIRLAASLEGPYIVPVHASGVIDGRPYYVMWYCPTGTLRDRLNRDGRLPLDDALTIAGNVAEALGVAHANNVVHLDIKPENILLEPNRALLADFGIAKALAAAESDPRTTAPGPMGTPLYISPEQAASEPVAPASDIYSLACVIYEMLAGVPPFVGHTAWAVIEHHLHAPPPRVRDARPDAAPLDAALLRALAKKPEDRFTSATAFVDALRAAASAARTRRRRRLMWAAGMTAGAMVATSVAQRFLASVAAPGAATTAARTRLDSLRYVVAPFVYDSATTPRVDERRRISDELHQWTDVDVADKPGTDAVPGDSAPSRAAALAIARHTRAGRLIWGTAERLGRSVRLQAMLIDANADSTIRQAVARVPTTSGDIDAQFRQLTIRLLLPDVAFGDRDIATGATTSLIASQSFRGAIRAITDWDLDRADTLLAAATLADPDFALGHLWLAMVRHWKLQPVSHWAGEAARAQAGRMRLRERERAFAAAMSQAAGDTLAWACPMWEQLGKRYPDDFDAWYGLATCLRQDEIVVRDAASPTGWRFRSSYSRALLAYQRAFNLWPASYSGLRRGFFEEIRTRFVTSPRMIRQGVALPPDTGYFQASPAWDNGLVFIPSPLFGPSSSKLANGRSSLYEAVKHQRVLFRDIATSWVTRYPSSPAALEALSVALEMLGDAPAALDTLRRARRLATASDDRVRIAGAEVWLTVKFALPGDTLGLRRAANLADSVLDATIDSPTIEPGLVASIAALRGRVRRAAQSSRAYARLAAGDTPGAVAVPQHELLALSILGGSADTLRALADAVASAIDRTIPVPDQQRTRITSLGRPATLAFPDSTFPALPALAGKGMPLFDAQMLAAKGDTAAAIRAVTEINARRASRLYQPWDLTVDAVYPEAALFAKLGRAREARTQLDPVLRSLALAEPQHFADVANAGALVRSMALRADLAERAEDAKTARAWAGAVGLLWENCDPQLIPIRDRMRRLSRP
jgi:hypothetical protein